jgi:hypothetical protein
MSGRRVFLTVVVALVVIGLLIAGGVALYRLGYARGIAAVVTSARNGQLPRFPERGMPGFDGGRMQVWPYGGMMLYEGHRSLGVFGFVGPIVGLLLLAGLVTLVVLGIRALTHKHPAEVQAAPAPVTPAIVESTPAKPARGARRTKTS